MPVLVVELNNGVYCPAIQLGSYQMVNDDDDQLIDRAIKSAVALGYHAVDGARAYCNEHIVCPSVLTAGPSREPAYPVNLGGLPPTLKLISEDEWAKNVSVPFGDSPEHRVWITTKVEPGFTDPVKVKAHIEQHLNLSRRERIDMILLHWPGYFDRQWIDGVQPDCNCDQTRADAWRVLEALYHQKKVRAIGVSNYMYKHLRGLIDNIEGRRKAGDSQAVMPMCNQCEYHPLLGWDKALEDLMAEYRIVGAAYSPLCRLKPAFSDHPLTKELCAKYQTLPSTLAVRFVIQNGICALPKATSKEHQKANLEACSLSIDPEDMIRMQELQAKTQLRICPDPNLIN